MKLPLGFFPSQVKCSSSLRQCEERAAGQSLEMTQPLQSMVAPGLPPTPVAMLLQVSRAGTLGWAWALHREPPNLHGWLPATCSPLWNPARPLLSACSIPWWTQGSPLWGLPWSLSLPHSPSSSP